MFQHCSTHGDYLQENCTACKEVQKFQGKKENKIIEILQHKISYYYENDMNMPESDQEHVKQMITDGYNAGELCCIPDNQKVEAYGWWSIEKLS